MLLGQVVINTYEAPWVQCLPQNFEQEVLEMSHCPPNPWCSQRFSVPPANASDMACLKRSGVMMPWPLPLAPEGGVTAAAAGVGLLGAGDWLLDADL